MAKPFCPSCKKQVNAKLVSDLKVIDQQLKKTGTSGQIFLECEDGHIFSFRHTGTYKK